MSQQNLQFGDQVQHRKRPEWGVGSVVKVEETTVNGQRTQRVSVRFPNAGIKTLSTQHADLERIANEAVATVAAAARPTVAAFDKMGDSEWLAPMAQRKVMEMMIGLPEEARDPFNGLRGRLEFTLQLYRFDRSGRGLMDWAVAQSGLDDPLVRFSRQELEQHFDRWSIERDNHLRQLLHEARGNKALVTELIASAPPPARTLVRRFTGQR